MTFHALCFCQVLLGNSLKAPLYWVRLELGTESVMLNNAFVSMKDENSKWLNKVEDLLWRIGLREVWLNPH